MDEDGHLKVAGHVVNRQYSLMPHIWLTRELKIEHVQSSLVSRIWPLVTSSVPTQGIYQYISEIYQYISGIY